MRMNRTLAYGLACLEVLDTRGGGGRWLDAREISRLENLPVAYCNKVLAALCHMGLVESARGRGYRLAKPLDDIRAWDVVEAFTFNGAPPAGRPGASSALYLTLREQVNRWLVGLTVRDIVETARHEGRLAGGAGARP